MRYLSEAFGINAPSQAPIPTVHEFRLALWQRLDDQDFTLPLLVVDEAQDTATTGSEQRLVLLRDILCAAGIAGIFMGTAVNDVMRVMAPAYQSSRGLGVHLYRLWARFLTALSLYGPQTGNPGLHLRTALGHHLRTALGHHPRARK